MEQSAIPSDVRRFISLRIPSVPYLEAILLLRDGAAQGWTAQQVAQRLYLDEASAARLLRQLFDARIAVRVANAGEADQYRYAPQPNGLKDMLDRLALAYSQHLIDVSTLIHLKANKKAQVFADAFVWKKEP